MEKFLVAYKWWYHTSAHNSAPKYTQWYYSLVWADDYKGAEEKIKKHYGKVPPPAIDWDNADTWGVEIANPNL